MSITHTLHFVLFSFTARHILVDVRSMALKPAVTSLFIQPTMLMSNWTLFWKIVPWRSCESRIIRDRPVCNLARYQNVQRAPLLPWRSCRNCSTLFCIALSASRYTELKHWGKNTIPYGAIEGSFIVYKTIVYVDLCFVGLFQDL